MFFRKNALIYFTQEFGKLSTIDSRQNKFLILETWQNFEIWTINKNNKSKLLFDRKYWNFGKWLKIKNSLKPIFETFFSTVHFLLQGHEDQIFSAEWSGCGQFLATVCKDGKIRIFNPRQSQSPILEGGEITPKKGARVAWVLNEQYLVVTGFSR